MSKSFRDLVEALNAKTRTKNPSMKGHVGGKPAAAGEAEFAKDMYPAKVGGENDKPYPVKDTDDKLNARKTKQTAKAEPGVAGEKQTPKQGTSSPSNPFGFKGSQTSPNRGDNRQGDKKPVKTSPSSVKTVTESSKSLKRFNEIVKIKESHQITEDVMAQLKKIAAGVSEGKVNFADGDSTNVSPDTAKRMIAAQQKLAPQNAKKFAESINKSPEGFLKMMAFSSKHGEK